MKQLNRLFLAVFAFALIFPSVGKADSLRGKYFMVVFGYQGQGNRAVDSHTFATFIDGTELENGRTSGFPTISWLPATGVVRPLRREPGYNFSLEQTLNIARQNRYQVQSFGPYQISYDLYQRAGWQIERLNSGALLYKMINGPFSAGAINCIHAVSEIGGDLNTGTLWGFAASFKVVQFFKQFIYSFPEPNSDVATRIQLSKLIRGF